MNHEERQEQEWKKSWRVFSRIPKPAGSERFVQSVMLRVRALEQRTIEPLSILARWLMPAFAVAAFCLSLSIVVSPADTVSMDSVLFSQARGAFVDPLALPER